MKKVRPADPDPEETHVLSLMTLALQNLFRLQALDFDESPARPPRPRAAELRSQIPSFILDRYDRLRARDKKAIAMVLNSTCTACHMRQPIGKMASLLRGEEIQVCDSCGRYLLLPVTAQAPVAGAQSADHRIASAQVAR